MNKSQKQIMEVVTVLKKSDVPYNLTLEYWDYELPYLSEEVNLNDQPESKLKEIFKKVLPNYIMKIDIGYKSGYDLPRFFVRKYRTEQNEIEINYLKSMITDDYQDTVKVETVKELLWLQYTRSLFEEQIINLRRKTRLDNIFNDNQPISLES